MEGIYDDFASHGYCSTSSWFVRLQESYLRQSDKSGALHPNRGGQAAIGARILGAVQPDLYPGGVARAPGE